MNERREPADPASPIDERGSANRLPVRTRARFRWIQEDRKFADLGAPLPALGPSWPTSRLATPA
jgi:hypothetical protein